MDKMRDAFEAWAAEEAEVRGVGELIGLLKEEHHDRYAMIWTQTAWVAWQASRAALVIELPAENPIGSGPGDCEDGLPSFEQHCAAECNFIIRDCREAIEAVGLKVTP